MGREVSREEVEYRGAFGDKASAINWHWETGREKVAVSCHGLSLCLGCRRTAEALQAEYERGLRDGRATPAKPCQDCIGPDSEIPCPEHCATGEPCPFCAGKETP